MYFVMWQEETSQKKLIEEINFPEELIVNRSVDVFKEYIHRKYKEDK